MVVRTASHRSEVARDRVEILVASSPSDGRGAGSVQDGVVGVTGNMIVAKGPARLYT